MAVNTEEGGRPLAVVVAMVLVLRGMENTEDVGERGKGWGSSLLFEELEEGGRRKGRESGRGGTGGGGVDVSLERAARRERAVTVWSSSSFSEYPRSKSRS